MSRRTLMPAVLLVIMAGGWTRTAQPAGPLQEAELDAETMKAALRTATPEEDGFIERVLDLVAERVLPVDLVASTFQWARRKPRRKFQYFRFGLIRRARERGIDI